MRSSDFTYQILQLTDKFYQDYPNPPFIEILKKKHRAYNCLLIPADGYLICIPYRSNILHPYAYHFTSSKRSRSNKSGLDYTKIVIIQNRDYLSGSVAVIDNDEYNETVLHIEQIVSKACCFVDDYILHMKGIHLLHNREFARRYQYSPLMYFHDILGVEEIA